MSIKEMSIAQRYEVVQLAKKGVSAYQLGVRFSMSARTVRLLVLRYDREGINGLNDKRPLYYPEQTKLKILRDYETNGLSLDEICYKYDISKAAFSRWLKLYESYKKGDKFALNGNGIMHRCDMPGVAATKDIKQQSPTMPETEERQRRREALSKLTKKELQELLLDREAELDILKNLEALARKRENERHGILRKLSKD